MQRSSLFVILLALVVGCGEDRSHIQRLNLILISLDTCRADRLSVYGARRENTPNLDDFAAEAILFRDCLAQSALTAPSHLSMLTGHYVHRHGLFNNQGSRKPPYSLASLLGSLGWRTAAFTGHGSFQSKHAGGFGFDTFQSWVGPEREPFSRNLDEVLPHANAWLDEHRRDHPHDNFFLLVHGYDPHCPFVPPDEFGMKYGDWYEGALELDGVCHPKEFRSKMEDGEIGRDELRYINDMYDAEVAAADELLGAFFDDLEQRGLFENSIVVFTSDHGEVLGNHGWIGHGQTWEEALKVPLIVRFPGGQWAASHDAPVQHVDLVPTLLSALGAAPPPGLQGIDLMPLVRGEAQPVGAERMRVSRVGVFPNQVAVRFGKRWKIMFEERSNGPHQPRLFDLRKDALERTNLARTEEGRPRFDEIYARYQAWRESTREDDVRFGAREGAALDSPADLEALRALGYVGDDEGKH